MVDVRLPPSLLTCEGQRREENKERKMEREEGTWEGRGKGSGGKGREKIRMRGYKFYGGSCKGTDPFLRPHHDNFT